MNLRRCSLALALTVGLSPAARAAPPSARELAASAERAVDSGEWTAHAARLDAFWAGDRPEAWSRMVMRDPGRTALAHATLIARAGGPGLTRLTEVDEGREFLRWLLDRTDALEDFLEALPAEHDAGRALDLWRTLWARDPDGRDRFHRLSIAVALVYTRPRSVLPELGGGAIDPAARYRWYREAADARALRYDPRQLTVPDLVWVVDAPVPESELDWALRNVRTNPSAWHLVGGQVPFDERGSRGQATRAPDATLASLRRFGGSRADQARFAVTAAKANGIPAMLIRGTGADGPRAWYGYRATAASWNFRGGQYQDDRYPAGTATDPQSGGDLRESDLARLDDPQRRGEGWRTATRWTWLARRLRDLDRPDHAMAALSAARAAADRHPEVWDLRMAWLEADGADTEAWADLLGSLRAAFRRHPDMVARAETRRTAALGRADGQEVRDDLVAIRRQATRGDEPPVQPALDQLAREVERRRAEGDTAGIRRLYQDHLRTLGGQVPAFRALATDYYAFARREGFAPEAAREIDRTFARNYPRSGSEPQAVRARLDLLRMIAGFYRDAGETARAETMERQIERMEGRF